MLLTLRPRSPCRAAKKGPWVGAADPRGMRSLAEMKKIEAIIKPFKLDEVKEALQEAGNPRNHRPRGERLRPAKGTYRALSGAEYVVDFLPKVKIEVVGFGRKSPSGDRSDPQCGANGPDRGWQDICIADRGSHSHPHRRDRRRRGLKAFQADGGPATLGGRGRKLIIKERANGRDRQGCPEGDKGTRR